MKKILVFIFILSPMMAMADWVDDMKLMQNQWAKFNYLTTKSGKQEGLEQLLDIANDKLAIYPDQPEILIWHAIIEASYAGSLSAINPTALGYVKSAKKHLEEAIEIDGDVLDGSAYTSLGSLYYQVPGWPIGFGDADKANKYLKKGLALNPNGIDSNFFYADFLIDKGEIEEAKEYLTKARKAPSRPGREDADQGRRIEVLQLIEKIKK
jgi:tetratricopeptide (TPR) repeat protein